MFKKVDKDMNLVNRENKVLNYWKENNIINKCLDKDKQNADRNSSYVFYDGPPTANGKPHIGHVETRSFKDLIPRFYSMKGKFVPRKAGWDTHGLPVEIEVEKQLGINGKEQIEKYGIEPFISKCKENVWKYKQMWEEFSYKVAFFADMDNPYVTYYDDYIESEWWALKQMWDKGESIFLWLQKASEKRSNRLVYSESLIMSSHISSTSKAVRICLSSASFSAPGMMIILFSVLSLTLKN